MEGARWQGDDDGAMPAGRDRDASPAACLIHSFSERPLPTRTLVAGCIASALLLRWALSAAFGRSTRRIRVGLVDSLSAPTACAEILRFSEGSRPDLILLRDGTATPDDLAAAIRAYGTSGTRRPTRAGTVARTTVVSRPSNGPIADRLRLRAGEMLAEVRRALPTRIGNLGRGRWSEFDVRAGR